MTEFMKVLALVLVLLPLSVGAATPTVLPTVPKGLKASVFAEVRNAREMAISPTGRVYVGSEEAGQVALVEKGKTHIMLEGLLIPNGVAWHNGDLYIAELQKLSVIRGVDKWVPGTKPKLETIKVSLPSDQHHGAKYIAIGPDNKLYIPVGAPCNVCLKPLPYAALHRMDLDGKNFTTIAEGIRNTVGFAWHPETKQLWFTDNGRDQMGDNVPPDEVNILVKEKTHFGFPYIHAHFKDSYFFPQAPAKFESVPATIEVQAHSATLGLAFTHKTQLSKLYPNCVIVAEHGSWNRSSKVGYQVSVSCPDKAKKFPPLQPLMTGLLNLGQVSGRPVDVKFLPDGALLVSDDYANKIWKIEADGGSK